MAGVVVAAPVLTVRVARSRASAKRASVLLGRLRLRQPSPPVEERRSAGAALHADAIAVVGSPSNRIGLDAISVGSALAGAGCLWASLEAVGISLPHERFSWPGFAGSIAIWLQLLPGGLGFVEEAVPAVLRCVGVPLDDGLAGSLIYRDLGTFLPALVGSAVLARLRARRRKVRTPRRH